VFFEFLNSTFNTIVWFSEKCIQSNSSGTESFARHTFRGPSITCGVDGYWPVIQARVILQERSRARSAPLMQQLHWRIMFKLATLTYRALQTGRPPYLADLIQFHTTPKSTRSSSSQLLFVPCRNLSIGSQAFHVSAPKVWNTLPLHIRQSQSLSSVHFQMLSKVTLLPVSLCFYLASTYQCALVLFFQTLALYKSFTYLQ